MFNALRQKLQTFQKKVGDSIKGAAPPEPVPEVPVQKEEKPAKPTFGQKVKTLVIERELIIAEKDITESLQDLEWALLENDVAVDAAGSIIAGLRHELVGKHRRIGESVDTLVQEALRGALVRVLGDGLDLFAFIRSRPKPVRILFTGVNGTGKTTTVAKVGHYLKKNGFSVVIASGDTFRAGAQDQLAIHADRVGIRVIQHKSGGDPSAVIFDAVQYATAHNVDVVLADTAGRFHNRANLMNQLEKIKRIMKPDLVVYVDEAVAGNDAVVRAGEFAAWVGTDAVILTKADMDPKGGAAISITHATGKPILFLGTGQEYGDLRPFTPALIVNELLGGEVPA